MCVCVCFAEPYKSTNGLPRCLCQQQDRNGISAAALLVPSPASEPVCPCTRARVPRRRGFIPRFAGCPECFAQGYSQGHSHQQSSHQATVQDFHSHPKARWDCRAAIHGLATAPPVIKGGSEQNPVACRRAQVFAAVLHHHLLGPNLRKSGATVKRYSQA